MWRGMKSLKHPVNNQNIVKSRIRQEWESFTKHTLLYDKETIQNMCDKIHFYDCVMIFFSENDQIPKEVYNFLYHREEIILNMWLLYLKQEHLGFLTWAELGVLLEFWMEL